MECDIKVSVVIPTYGRTTYLKRAIDSVVRQKYKNIEIVVVDDNGTDYETSKIVKDIIDEYPLTVNIRYIKNAKNVGGAVTRNNGISESSGTYVTFLDDDDEYLPDKIMYQLSCMRKSDSDMSFMDDANYRNDGTCINVHKQVVPDNFERESLLKNHILYHFTGTNTFMFKKEALERIGGFPNVPAGQEFALMMRTIENGLKVQYINKVLVKNYLHEGERISVGKKKRDAQKEILAMKKEHFDLLNRKEKRFVFCRNYLVIAYTYIKEHSVISKIYSVYYLLMALLISPSSMWKIAKKQKNKLRKF